METISQPPKNSELSAGPVLIYIQGCPNDLFCSDR